MTIQRMLITKASRAMSDNVFEVRFSKGSVFKDNPSSFLLGFLEGRREMFEGERALDIGCGNGRNLQALLSANMIACGIDSSSEAVALAAERFQKAILVHCQAQYLPFPESSFGLVYAGTTLSCLKEQELYKAFGEIMRVLKPGGFFLFSDFTVNDPGATGVGLASEFAGAIQHYFDPHDIELLLNEFEIQSIETLAKRDSSHGAPHSHSLLRVIARKEAVHAR